MERKRGMSKIAIVLIIFVILIIIAAATVLTIWLIKENSKPPVEVKLYDDFVEGEDFLDEDLVGETMQPLGNGLKEYRNDELGVRFGYLDSMDEPEDEVTEDDIYISTIKSKKDSVIIQARVGKIDLSQSDIDHVQKQREALTRELIKAETRTEIVEENGKEVEKIIVPEKVSDINTSYSLINGQLAVKMTYTENGMKATRLLTIRDETAFSLTYKANENDYKTADQDKVFESFEFIDKIDDVKKTELNTVTIDNKEYTLPIKVSNIEGLNIDSKYSVQKITPNYFTIVSLYQLQNPKYSAYVYNAKASTDEIGKGYLTAISTDIQRGGNIKIYKGIELGTSYQRVKELLGVPSKQYYSDDESTLTNIYQREDVTIQLKFRNNDLSKPGDSSNVVSILLKVAR